MSDKVKHEKGEFQLQVPPGLPLLVSGAVKGLVEYLNNIDLNHDGKSDVAQAAPYVIKALPVLIDLLKLIDSKELKAFLLDSKIVVDKVAAAACIDKLVDIADDAAKLAPKQ